ncbi:MAG: DUF6293 family protein [Thermoplasmatota archaeon]
MKESKGIAHIIPMGLEVDRVLGGLRMFPTNRAIFLYGSDRGSEIEKKARENGRRIKEMVSATIRIEDRELDIFDFYDAARKLRELIEGLTGEGHSVYINLSTGNRIVTSAALLACFMTNSHPYYVRPERYSIPEDQFVLSHGVAGVMEIPSVTILGPSGAGVKVLKVLSSQGGSVRYETSLIPQLEMVGDFFKERNEGETKKAFMARKKAHLSRVLKGLGKEGYVSLVRRGKYVSVSLTETGLLFSGPPQKV